jgi:anti-sigma-K factor RskA
MRCEHHDDVGAWVLGALPGDERERFAAHLAGCETCAGEVTELQMVADTLPLAAQQMAPPPELKERIMSVVRAEAAVMSAAGPAADEPGVATEQAVTAPRPAAAPAPEPARPRRRRPSWWHRPALALRPIPAAVAAAVLVAIGVGGGILLSGGDSGRTVPAQVVAPSAPGARASLTIDEGERATLRVRDFPAPPRGRVYQVWLKRPGRPPDPTTALFTVRGGDATVEVPGSVDGVDQLLVTAEPDGGSRQPTRDPVIVATPA